MHSGRMRPAPRRKRRENGSKSRPSAIVPPSNKPRRLRMAVGLAVWIVMVKVVPLVPSVIGFGEKDTVAPGGRPVAERTIGKGNATLSGAILKLKVAA